MNGQFYSDYAIGAGALCCLGHVQLLSAHQTARKAQPAYDAVEPNRYGMLGHQFYDRRAFGQSFRV